MRPFVLLAAAAVALALSAPAGAKELVRAELCGPAGCATVTDRDDLRLVPTGGRTTAGPPAIGAYLELVLTVADGRGGTDTDSWTVWYVPSAGMLAAAGETGEMTFFPTYGAGAAFMKQLAKSVRPYPAPRITGAFVNGKPVAGDAATYAQLFTAQSTGSTQAAGDWVPIDLVSVARSPWTNGGVSLRYSPGAGVLLRGPDAVKLDGGVADDVARARALGTAGDGTTQLPWLAAAGLLAAMLLVAALGAVLRRRPGTAGSPEATAA